MKLKPGDKAPEFSGKDQDGKTVKLSGFKGKKLILYFYPKDDTPACTVQACNLRDNHTALKKKGYKVIGISSDTERKHRKFIEKYSLPFPLIADVDKAIHDLYGVWGEKMLFGRKYMGTLRTTFVIDENGIIEKVIDKVDTKEHTSQIV
jgi:thioredoxin-dependent peroxiredoxin